MSEKLTKIIEKADSDRSAGDELDIDSLSESAQLGVLKAQRYRADTESRKWLAQWSAVVVTSWLIAAVIILVLNTSNKLGLADTVLSVLLGTTTLNILGLMFIVLKGYFRGDEQVASNGSFMPDFSQ